MESCDGHHRFLLPILLFALLLSLSRYASSSSSSPRPELAIASSASSSCAAGSDKKVESRQILIEPDASAVASSSGDLGLKATYVTAHALSFSPVTLRVTC